MANIRRRRPSRRAAASQSGQLRCCCRRPCHVIGCHVIGCHVIGRGRLPHLRGGRVAGNRALGDGGAAALAEALADCASLETLRFQGCGVGRAGFEAVAACVPRWPRLRSLVAGANPGPSDALVRALAAALPSLPGAELFALRDSGLGEGAAAELRAAKAKAGRPEELYV